MTTKNARRSGDKQLGQWKLVLAAGAVAASLAGTRLVAEKDAAQTAVPATTTIVVPAPAANTTTASGSLQQIELAPVPTAVSPVAMPVQPIVRTRSSR